MRVCEAEDLIEGYLSLLHIWENSLGQPIRCMILKDCQSNSSWIPYAANEIARTPEFRQARGIRIKTSAFYEGASERMLSFKLSFHAQTES